MTATTRMGPVGRLLPRRVMSPLLCLPLMALLAASPAHAGKGIILANVMDGGHVQNVASRAFIAKLEELSGGEIQVEHHPGGDLGDWVGLFEQTMHGGIQMTQTWNASEFDSRLDLATLGYTAGTWEECVETYKPGGPMAAFWDTVLQDLNLRLTGILPDGMYGVAVRKGVDAPTSYPEDGQGFKLRVPPIKIGITRFEALGFSAVPMPFSELYTALQLGTVDGAAFQDAQTVSTMADVYDHYVRTNDICGYSFWLSNADWWNGLSDDERTTIQSAADHAVSVAWQEFKAIDDKAIEDMKNAGMQVHYLNDAELEAAKQIVFEVEWPWIETQVGAETMAAVREALGM